LWFFQHFITQLAFKIKVSITSNLKIQAEKGRGRVNGKAGKGNA